MLPRKKVVFKPALLVIIGLILGLVISSQFLPATHAQSANISQESIDFLTKTGRAMAEVTAAVKPAIVNISTSRTIKISGGMDPFDDPFFRRFFGDNFRHPKQQKEQKSVGLGSGVIVSSDGYIITNYHVVKDAEEIKVLLSDRKEYTGKVIGSDPKTELSIVKIEANGLPTVSWGNSDQLEVGEVVLAVGNPYGLNQTVTMGIVSAMGRANVGIADYEDFIQTDAAINPGNSGGALVNVKGELVGINTAIYSTTGGYQGIGFAIPSNMVKSVMASLIKKGKVVRGWLGVSIQPITPELAKQFSLKEDIGALVGDVVENSPAEKAGMKRGDVIIEYDGRKIEEPNALRNMVANTSPGGEHEVKIIRNNQPLSLKVTVGELPVEEQGEVVSAAVYENVMKGVTVQDLTPEIEKKLKIPGRIKGVVVTDVSEESPAAGVLAPGDVIQEVNRKKTVDTKSYEEIVSRITKDEDVLLLIYRKGISVFITLSQK
ncbi:MAG: DegQ family serine endoprotease [Nitrospirota bacterium]|nr:DegQ family serine endoprotease [Nitrospirota bacterium]